MTTEAISVLDEMVYDDPTPIQLKVKIGSTHYLLREATEEAACCYKNACMRATKMSEGKVVGIDGMADTDPLFLSMCLVEIVGNGERCVPIKTIRSWPTKLVKSLVEKLKKISEMEGETQEILEKRLKDTQAKLAKLSEVKEGDRDESAKNGQGATTGISV